MMWLTVVNRAQEHLVRLDLNWHPHAYFDEVTDLRGRILYVQGRSVMVDPVERKDHPLTAP
jgi:hypothetical protein